MSYRVFANRNALLVSLAFTALFLTFAMRQHFFVDRYAVNILCWDQWDFYTPLFHDSGMWAIFDRRHGPHRQGIGFILTSISGLKNRFWSNAPCVFYIALLLAGTVRLHTSDWRKYILTATIAAPGRRHISRLMMKDKQAARQIFLFTRHLNCRVG